MLLVGARAALHWFPDFPRADCWDLWCTDDTLVHHCLAEGKASVFETGSANGRTRYRITHEGRCAELLVARTGGSEQAFSDAAVATVDIDWLGLRDVKVASPQALALIKRSHLHSPANWQKHIDDYHFLKRRAPSAPTDAERAAGAMRMAEWAANHPGDYGSGSMRVSNEAFFANTRMARIRVYVHDDLHRVTCYGPEPLYLRLKEDRSQAFVSGRLFETFTHAEKIRLVREECYALALERVVIPAIETGRTADARHAFLHALRRICTDLTTGWFRDFAVEHYPEVIEFDTDYVGRFRAALERSDLVRRAERPAKADLEALVEEVARRDRAAGLGEFARGESIDALQA